MTIIYRSVKGSNLTPDEVDGNFEDLDDRVTDLANNPPEARSIEDFDVAGDQLTINMSDSTSEGPFTLPTVQFNDRGTWAPLTVYAKYDTFTKDGTYYLVIFAHTSAATFDPGANNGLGQDYYRAMFSNPDTLDDMQDVNTGGTDGPSHGDALVWDDVNEEWIAGTPLIDGTQVTFHHSTDGTLTSAWVSDAIEEVEARVAAVAGELLTINALDVVFTPTTDSAIAAGNVSDAIEELESDTAALLAAKLGLADVVGVQTIWVPASAMVPRTTNGPSPGTSELSSNKNMVKTLDFDTSTQEFAQFDIAMPKSWNNGTVTFIPYWSHAATVTNFGVVWGVDAVAISNDDALDVAFGTEQTSTDTGGTTDDLYSGPESSAITIAGTPATGDLVQFRIHRNPANGSDNLAVDARLHGVRLLYTTNAANDT